MEGKTEVAAVQAFGRKKTAVAVAHCKSGHGLIKVNGSPIDIIEPQCLKLKAVEPILLLGADKFANVDIRVTVNGGGRVAQIYAIRQAIARAIVAYYQKCMHFALGDVDEESKRALKEILTAHDRLLLVTDSRRREPKKYGGRSARARFQKSYR